MSRRIAHRPRYRNYRQLPPSTQHSHKEFFRTHWTYRSMNMLYHKHRKALGQNLLMVPVYRLVHSIMQP